MRRTQEERARHLQARRRQARDVLARRLKVEHGQAVRERGRRRLRRRARSGHAVACHTDKSGAHEQHLRVHAMRGLLLFGAPAGACLPTQAQAHQARACPRSMFYVTSRRSHALTHMRCCQARCCRETEDIAHDERIGS